VWPENWTALVVFSRVQTQWSVGVAGPIGLRSEALAFELEISGVPREQWAEVVAGVRLMERETLRLYRESRD
jgi:hypothetical protein